MAKNMFLATILVFLIVADVSNAAFIWPFRKLIAPSPKENPNISPIPSTVNDGKQSSSVGNEEKGKEKENKPNPDLNKPKGKVDQGAIPPSGTKEDNKNPKEEVKDKGANKPENPPIDTKKEDKNPKEEVKDKGGNKPVTAPIDTDTKKEGKTPKEEVKEKGESKPDLPHGVKESCNGISHKCQDTKSMIACVKSSNDVSKALILLIQNEGDSDINVDLTILPSLDKKKLTDVPKHQTEMVSVLLPNGGTNEIRLNAGYGDCILHLGAPVSQVNFFRNLPSYSKFITPIYGAYLLFLILLISGGVWACCWVRKRRSHTHSEIQYQELEMSVPETAAVVETAEGWDQDWDDDWDEEKAVTSPGARNISANGLSSRTPSKDGWEDWDD